MLFCYFYIGKEAKNATLSHGVVMCQAIKNYHDKTGFQVYFILYCLSKFNYKVLL